MSFCARNVLQNKNALKTVVNKEKTVFFEWFGVLIAIMDALNFNITT